MNFKKTFSAALVAGTILATGSAGAVVFPDFTVDPDLTASTTNNFTADKITGNYVETLNLNPDGTFSFSLHWDAGQFVANDGTTALTSAATLLGAAGGYLLYADTSGTGTFVTAGTITTFTLNPGGPLSLTRSPDLVIGGDTVIANGTSLAGSSGTFTASSTCGTAGGTGINCGSFGQNTTFALNAAGSTFFVDPIPFYNLSFQSGQFNNINLANFDNQTINGSVDVVFGSVPEPTSIALLGLALLGVGFTQRRKA